ncbi:MAG TPA: flavin monoamine oxidase family protein [Casimicrobiaceae bacterium]|nr:flavin monoamine oxidase family protein [Casimicrobiaceae bacterium]
MTIAGSPWLPIIRDGLPRVGGPRKKVIVVGAGIAGLVAAHELARAGHEPQILEAQHRVGGRILTLRDCFTPGLYSEAGAMRIPRTHSLTLAYAEKFGLELRPFTLQNPEAYCHLFGHKHRWREIDADPALLSGEMADEERGITCNKRWEAAIRPLADEVEREGEAGWAAIVKRYDGYSTRQFLQREHWPEAAIELFGLLQNQEALMNSCFLELLREEIGRFYVDLLQINGGMDLLPRSFMPSLASRIRFGARMFAIEPGQTSVTIHYRTVGGRERSVGDYAIITVPFPVLRHVEVTQPFSAAKRRAIRQLRYDASAKIFLQFRRRFWEEDEGIFGGGTVTDLPIRNVFYPEHGRETGRGVVLASYTWSEDAQRWGSLPAEERIDQALEDLAAIHPQAPYEYEAGASKMWHDDPYAGGAFALFEPGQQGLLHSHIISPEGRVHFAGEHASLAHAWIQGAIESGLRAAGDINARN